MELACQLQYSLLVEITTVADPPSNALLRGV